MVTPGGVAANGPTRIPDGASGSAGSVGVREANAPDITSGDCSTQSSSGLVVVTLKTTL